MISTLKKRNEQDLHFTEQQEILEICGEEFIMRIHDMINQFEGYQPFLESKATFKVTCST